MRGTKLFAAIAYGSLLIVAGCEPGNKVGNDEAAAGQIADAKEAGTGTDNFKNIPPEEISYGDLPSVKGPDGFKAEFSALVYFGLDADAKFVSTVRYFAAAGSDFPSIKNGILSCIAKLDASIKDACDGQLAAVTMDGLTFRAPTNIVFVARNSTLKFEPEALVFSKTLDKTHPDYPGGTKAMPNKSFYNAKIFTEGSRQLVYVSNYYTKKNGGNGNGNGVGDTPISKTEKYWYGLNIFMAIDQEGGEPVKIIIDPDTGNMGGQP